MIASALKRVEAQRASKRVEAIAIADYRSPRNATRSRNGNRPLILSGQVPRWYIQTAGPKSVRSGNGRPLIALRCLLLMLVSTPLHIISRCSSSGFPVSSGRPI